MREYAICNLDGIICLIWSDKTPEEMKRDWSGKGNMYPVSDINPALLTRYMYRVGLNHA